MDETPQKDSGLEELLVLQSEVKGIDMRLDALEHGYALDVARVDAFIKANVPDRPASYSDFLTTQELIDISRRYNDALNKGVGCDALDYALAAICGVLSGVVDALAIGSPDAGNAASKAADDLFDSTVKAFAKRCGWNPRIEHVDDVASAIGYLERKFPIGYDQTSSQAIGNMVHHLTPKNHHAKSLAHYPDVFGLIASICDQFTDEVAADSRTRNLIL
jgi:hypothetical protein